MDDKTNFDMPNNTIRCPNCHAITTKDLNFCPYCMEKFAQETDYNSKSLHQSNRKKITIIITIILIALLALGLFLYFSLSSQSPKGNNIDYTQYIGIWVNEPIRDGQNPYVDGSTALTIRKIDNESVIFDLEKVSGAPALRIARIENQSAAIEDGICKFRFASDGFDNAGKGEFRFENDKIYMKIEITEHNEDASFSIDFEGYMIPREQSVIDLVQAIGSDFANYKGNFGNGIPDVNLNPEGIWGGVTEYIYNDANIIVTLENEQIVTIFVDYTKTDDRTKYELDYDDSSRVINGNTPYVEVLACFGGGEYLSEEGMQVIGTFIDKDKGIFAKLFFSTTNSDARVDRIWIFVE